MNIAGLARSNKILEKYQPERYYSSMKAMQALLTLGEITADQGGLFTSAQARQRAVTRLQISRLAEIGAIDRIRHGVYRLSGVPSEVNDEVRAEWLSFRPELMSYHRYGDPNDFIAVGLTALELRFEGEFLSSEMSFAHSKRYQTTQPRVRIERRDIDLRMTTIELGVPTLRTQWVIFDLAVDGYDIGSLANLAREAHLKAADLEHEWAHHKLSPLHSRLLTELAFHEHQAIQYREAPRTVLSDGVTA